MRQGAKTTIVFVDKKPLCDLCAGHQLPGVHNPNAEKANWDAPTSGGGPWGYLCDRHLKSAGIPNSPMNVRLVERTAA